MRIYVQYHTVVYEWDIGNTILYYNFTNAY